jgi:hypothetical protein
VSVQVRDETGASVEGAEVRGTFSRSKTLNPFDGTVDTQDCSHTDQRGLCVVKGRGIPIVRVGASKEGYYSSLKVCSFVTEKDSEPRSGSVSVDLRMRRRIAPTAMYAKRLCRSLPAVGDPIGYDLLAGDWVAPYGRGEVSDLIFRGTLSFRARDDLDAMVTMSFARPDDGLAEVPEDLVMSESELALPHLAPEEGYLIHEASWGFVSRPKELSKRSSLRGSYWFLRIRTERDKEGRITRAMYGKVKGPMEIGVPMPGPTLDFGTMVYYANPDGTRNIEFDPKRNLIPNTPDYEKPTKP